MNNSINAKAKTDIFRIVDKSKGKIQQITKEVLLEIGRRLVARSPVGDPTTWHPPRWPKAYIPGTFVNNWQVGIDRKPTGTINTPDPTRAAAIERLSHLGRWQVGHVYYFVNNLPYAKAIEYGWSYNQAPLGIVGITRAEYSDIVKQVVAEFKSVPPPMGSGK